MNLLIVEDEALIRQGIVESVRWKELGLTLAGEASNGEAALEIMQTKRVDLVLTDMRMPVCDGRKLLQEMEAKGYDCETVVLSEYTDFPYMQQAIHAHVFDYLLKPVEPERLNEMLGKAAACLRQKRQQRRLLQKPLASLFQAAMSYDAPSDADPLLTSARNEYADSSFLAAVFRDFLPFERQDEFHELLCRRCESAPLEAAFLPSLSSPRYCFFAFTCPAEAEEALPAAEKWLACLAEEMTVLFSGRFLLGCSPRVQGFSSLRDAYRAAVTAVQFVSGDGRPLVRYDDVRRLPLDTSRPLPSKEQTLSFLKTGEKEALCQTALRALFSRAFASLSSIQSTLLQFIRLLEDCCQQENVRFSVSAERLSCLDGLCSYGEIRDFISVSVSDALASLSQPQCLTVEETIRLILQEIQEQYMKDLSLMGYANRFHINYIYLSKKFKEIAGDNFSSVLGKRRMEQARLLIQKEGRSEKEAAGMVGFSNPYYFSTVYQKYLDERTPKES